MKPVSSVQLSPPRVTSWHLEVSRACFYLLGVADKLPKRLMIDIEMFRHLPQ